jgi:hypothetical protein
VIPGCHYLLFSAIIVGCKLAIRRSRLSEQLQNNNLPLVFIQNLTNP